MGFASDPQYKIILKVPFLACISLHMQFLFTHIYIYTNIFIYLSMAI